MPVTTRLIYPYAHQVFFEGKPYYMDCVVGNCRMCERIECAKNLKVIDGIVKQLFRKPVTWE